MSVLLLYSKQWKALRTLVIGLDGMDMIFKLVASHKLKAITLFQAISGFNNPSHESKWNRCDLQTGNFS